MCAVCLAAVPALAFPLFMARMTSCLLISPPLDVPEGEGDRIENKTKNRREGEDRIE